MSPRVGLSLTVPTVALALVVCPLIGLAAALPSDAGEQVATAKKVDGDVSVLRDFQEWAIVPGDKVKPKETIVSGIDGHATFQVADGSTFEIYPNSKVIFRNNQGSWRDLLDVFLGKVRVKIEHFGEEENRNRVITPTAVISVRGTMFDITVDPQDEDTLVEVVEGEVGVRHALLPDNREAILQPGDSIRVYRNEPIAKARIDKGGVMQRIVQMAREAAIVAARSTSPTGGGLGPIGGGGGPVGGVGDTGPGSVPGVPGGPPTTAPPGTSGGSGAPTTAPPSITSTPGGGPLMAPPSF